MARPRKASSQHQFSAGQAKYILERLIRERRISSAEVKRYADDIRREIGDLELRLQSLREAAGEAVRGAIQALTPGRRRGRPPGSGAKKAASAAAPAPARKRRRARITAEQLASRQLQGRYLGLIRQIPATRRGQYQKIAKERGREAAIKEMAAALHK